MISKIELKDFKNISSFDTELSSINIFNLFKYYNLLSAEKFNSFEFCSNIYYKTNIKKCQ